MKQNHTKAIRELNNCFPTERQDYDYTEEQETRKGTYVYVLHKRRHIPSQHLSHHLFVELSLATIHYKLYVELNTTGHK